MLNRLGQGSLGASNVGTHNPATVQTVEKPTDKKIPDPTNLAQFQDWLASTLGKTKEDPFTKSDLATVIPKVNPQIVPWLTQYVGWPIKYLGVASADLPVGFKIDLNVAKIVGKNVSENFSQDDLKTLQKKFNWSDEETAVGQPAVGHPIYEFDTLIGEAALSGLIELYTNPTKGTGLPNPFDVFAIFGKFLEFFMDGANILRLVAILGGAVLTLIGIRKVME